MTEDEYRQFVRDQRTEGREHVRRLCWDLRRRVFGKFPDPIDRDNIARLEARFGDLDTAMKQAAASLEPIKLSLDSFQHDVARWRAEQHLVLRVSLSVLPPSRVALITSPA